MRIVTLSFILALSACAGQPPAPAVVPVTRNVSSSPVVTTASSGAKTTDDAVVQAKRLGYTVVNENGEQLFCHKDARTGSHLATETTCLTAKQMEDLRLETQRRMQSFQMQQPPPSGK